MIISRTPLRISFFGGGTDYPTWFKKHGGVVLSTTIDKYCYITCRYLPPFFGDLKHRVVWRHVETVFTVSDILHPAVREGMKFLGFDDSKGLEIHYQADLPARAGMGSSSTFAVGLIKALSALQGQMISKHDLALKAIELEQNILKEYVGCQDQVAAAYGGLNVIRFLPSGEIVVDPVIISSMRKNQLQERLMLFYTGTGRSASSVAESVIANLNNKSDTLKKMQLNVETALSLLCGEDDLDIFGKLLHENWLLKREQSDLVSNPEIESIYNIARDHGAIGGKLLGAGKAGFMLFYVPTEKQESVRLALIKYLHVPFKFENESSTLIYYGIDQT